jgi:hypothetical protein
MMHFAFLPFLADAGLPMIMLTLPAMVVALVPVIVIEGLLCKKWLGLTTRQAISSNALSNVASTIVGVPLAWAILVGLEFGTMSSPALQNWNSPLATAVSFVLSSAWIGPVEGSQDWMIPAATLVLLVPFFFASYFVEYQVIRSMVGKFETRGTLLTAPRVKAAVRNANLVTYGIMFLATSVWLMVELRNMGR